MPKKSSLFVRERLLIEGSLRTGIKHIEIPLGNLVLRISSCVLLAEDLSTSCRLSAVSVEGKCDDKICCYQLDAMGQVQKTSNQRSVPVCSLSTSGLCPMHTSDELVATCTYKVAPNRTSRHHTTLVVDRSLAS